jgi:hypothetical protein
LDLICESTEGETLVIFLLEVLGACQNSGLLVVATVFDLSAKNVKAFKQLGVSEKTPFFQVLQSRFAAGVDPPHPLKCTCNIFHKHDVANVWLGVVLNGQRLSGAAKWADIVYETDKQNVLYHMLHNVNDRHLKVLHRMP